MYTSALEYEVGGGEGYLFHPVTGGVDRVMEGAFLTATPPYIVLAFWCTLLPCTGSQWTQYIKRLSLKYVGVEVAPKTLRSIFITWIRQSDAAPEVHSNITHCETCCTLHTPPSLYRY